VPVDSVPVDSLSVTAPAPAAAGPREDGSSSGRSSAAGDPTGPLADRIRTAIRDVADFPTPGIGFKDITPLLSDPALFSQVVAALADGAETEGIPGIDVVAGIEARGFILAAPVALALGVGFVPIRKAGKLPHRTVSTEYALEYGSSRLEVHADAVRDGDRVLIVDDVLATGGTAAAAGGLLEGLGANVVGMGFLLELAFLAGRERLAGRPVRSLVTY
jgi:adenine phosphoribosyltransferase